MSGTIVDDPIRICRACQTIYLEDPVMYEDPDICPACGAPADVPDFRAGNADDDFAIGSSGTVPEADHAYAGEAEAGDNV